MQLKKKFDGIGQVILFVLCTVFTASTGFAELKLESVEPTLKVLGSTDEDLKVALKGAGFDENTRVSMFMDVGNRMNVIGSVNLWKFAYDVAVDGNMAYVGSEKGLQIIDMSNPSAPTEIGAIETPNVREVAVAEGKAYMASSKGLEIIDVANSASPFRISSMNTPGDAEGVTVVGDTAYVVDWESLQIVSVSDPENPVAIGSVDIPPGARSVTVSENKAYVAGGLNGLHIIDMSNPANPKKIASVETESLGITEVAVIGDTVYAADKNKGIKLINVSDPSSPEVICWEDGTICSVDTSTGLANGIEVSGDKAYVPHGSAGLEVIDVANPSKPEVFGFVDTPGIANSIEVRGDAAYIVSQMGYEYSTLYLIDVSYPSNQNVTGAIADGYALRVVAKEDMAYVSYIPDGHGPSGLRIVDISNPFKPQEIGFVETSGTIWGITVIEDVLYAADGDLQIIDISNPISPGIIKTIATECSTRGVAVVENKAYVVGNSVSLEIIDISDPSKATIIGSINIPSDGGVEEIEVIGNTAYLAGYSGLQAIDVSNPSLPEKINSVDISECATDIAVIEDIAYMTVGCFADGLQIIDISNPSRPEKIDSVDTSGNGKGITIIGDVAYVAADNGGLQIINIGDPSNSKIVGSVDTLGFADDVAVTDGVAYVADFREGLVMIPVPVEIKPDKIEKNTTIGLTLPSPQMADHYTLKVFNETESDELAGAVTFVPPEEDYLLDTKAIIVRGTKGPDDDIQSQTQMAADHAYEALLYQGYTKESIFYLRSASPEDDDGEGVDRDATLDNLSYAINEWAMKEPSATELLLYLVGHGSDGMFTINADEKLDVGDLDGWLDGLQEKLDIHVVVVYDACQSGSFMPRLTPAGKERIVVTSTQAEENAIFWDEGRNSFSGHFWNAVSWGYDLNGAFHYAKEEMQNDQTALLDADGDGIPDETLTEARKICREYKPQINAPYIYDASEDQILYDETSVTLQASVSYVRDQSEIRRVWATIIPPDFQLPESPDIPVVDPLPPVEFELENNVYEATYENFAANGEYKIDIYAMSDEGVYSLPREIIVTKRPSDYIEDVSVLQTVYGENPSAKLWAKVNCNYQDIITKVWATITAENVIELELQDIDGDCTYEGTFENFTGEGSYSVEICATDEDGNKSSCLTTKIIWEESDGDSYELDDERNQASRIILSNPQPHNFHDSDDTDWVRFSGKSGEEYTIEVNNLTELCDATIEVHDSESMDPLKKTEPYESWKDYRYLDWDCPQDGVYYVKLSNSTGDFGGHVKYELKIYRPDAGDTGTITGVVTDAVSGKPVKDAIVTNTGGGDIYIVSEDDDGEYYITDSPGTYTLKVEADGYKEFETSITITKLEEGDDPPPPLNIEMIPLGDIDGDNGIDLKDVIFALQIMTGKAGLSQMVDRSSDVNGDNRIGLEEAVHLLRRLSGG